MSDEERSPEEEFQELMRQLFGAGGANLDPEQLSQLSGMQIDPAMMQNMMQHLQRAFADAGDSGISWDLAKRQALHIANQSDRGVSSAQRTSAADAFGLAQLWLSEASAISSLSDPPRSMTRGQWVEATLPVWQELAEPVATSISDALTRTLEEQAPEEMRSMIGNAGRLMRGIGGSLFATQLGQVVGNLSTEVVSGGDVGIPVMPAGIAAILPQNFADAGQGLEIDDDQLALYVATRELAHARLFRHAKWLRLHIMSQIADFARGIDVDTEALEELASRFDPSRPEELREALQSGALLPRRTEAQDAALARLENLLATVEGWVDVVTADATQRLPLADRITETVRRRRAVGGPAERALGSLVGLELRPRRLREAAAMWRAVTDAVGIEVRDGLWDYPDFMPSAEDIDDPSALIERLRARERGDRPAGDAFDDALAQLLADEASGADTRASHPVPESGSDVSDAATREDGRDGDGRDEDGPEESRPV